MKLLSINSIFIDNIDNIRQYIERTTNNLIK